MVCVGLPSDETIRAAPHPTVLIRNKLNVVGSMVGTYKETEEALDFVVRGLVKPVLTIGEMKDLDCLMDDISAEKLTGRIVIKISV
jgi:propanol-preferring alcohol dehydrogenase